MNNAFKVLPSRRKTVEPRDPRFLIVLFLAVVAGAFFVQRSLGLVLLMAYLLILYALAGGRMDRLMATTRKVAFFFALIVAINALLVEGTPLPSPLSLATREGIERGVFYGLRVVTVYGALLVLLALTSPESMAQGVSALVRPFSKSLARRVALHGFLSMGFLPLFADELNRIRTAQRFRGGGFEGGLLRRAERARALLIPLFVSAIHRSGQLAMVVELRRVPLTIEQILVLGRPARRDYVFAATTLIALVLAIRV